MLKNKINTDQHSKYWSLKIIIIIAVALCLLLVAIFVANASINYKYANVFLPGTKIASVDIGGLSYEQAKKKLQLRLDDFASHGFVYIGQNKKNTIYPIISSGAADSSFPLVLWQPEQSLEKILKFQKDEKPSNLLNKIRVMLGGKTWALDYTWDKGRHLDILQEDFKGILLAKKEASFQFEADNNLQINAEVIGQTFTYEQALKESEEQIKKSAEK